MFAAFFVFIPFSSTIPNTPTIFNNLSNCFKWRMLWEREFQRFTTPITFCPLILDSATRGRIFPASRLLKTTVCFDVPGLIPLVNSIIRVRNILVYEVRLRLQNTVPYISVVIWWSTVIHGSSVWAARSIETIPFRIFIMIHNTMEIILDATG